MDAFERIHDPEPRDIPSDALALADVPDDNAPWSDIARFALSFDGYAFAGSFERCAAIANGPAPEGLDELRVALFFEQRRWRHFGEAPDEQSMAHIRALLRGVRAHLEVRDRNAPA